MTDQAHELEVNGISLFVRTAGPDDGYPLLLLHGWPDSSRCWDRVSALLAPDYRLIIPDQRAFGRSAMPDGIESYRMKELLGDVTGLLDWAGANRAAIVGHDFGGSVTWQAGAWLAERLDSIVVFASPHPGRFRDVAAGNLGQMMKSFYSWLLQTDRGLALLAQDDARLMARFAFAGELPADEVEAYRQEWTADPGRLAAMANWYRANFTPDFLNPEVDLSIRPSRVPSLYVHGEKDFAFASEMATGSAAFVEAEAEDRVMPGASHWMPQMRSEDVAAHIRDWVERFK